MRTFTKSICLGLCLLVSSSIFAQSGGGPTIDPGGGGTPDGSSSPDPIAIAAAHILKGQTNNEQRRTIRLEWLTVAAQQAEDLLRNSAFQRIIEFVQKNHDLFESIYAGLKTANSYVATGKRVKSVVILQRNLLLEFAKTAELLNDTQYFTSDELRAFKGTLDEIIDDSEANFGLLVVIFKTTTNTKFTDLERFEVLDTIEQRLLDNVQAVSQLNRYITYLNTNRGVQLDGGTKIFTQPN